MKRILPAVLLLLAAQPRQVLAASAGAEPFNFLFLDGGARPAALGGAYAGLAADASALHYNPAGLAEMREHSALFMHNQYFEGLTQEYLSYAGPRGWGAALNYFSFGTVRRTTINNKTGAGLGQVGLTSLALSAGYGAAYGSDFSAGAAVKLIRENIAGYTGQAPALDLGLLYFPPKMASLTVGAAVQNIGGGVKFASASEKLPLAVRLGAAYRAKAAVPLRLAFDLQKSGSDPLYAALGAEAVLGGSFALRAGYSGRNDAGPGLTAGAGWAGPDLSVDYAFVPFGELGQAHRLSACWRWGGEAREKARRAAQAALPAPKKKKSEAQLRAEAFAASMAEARDYAAKKYYGKAQTSYEQALALRPDDADANAALGEIHMRAARYAEAEKVFLRAYRAAGESDPRAPQLQERLGAALYRQEKLVSAKKAFRLAIKLAEERGAEGTSRENAYYGLAVCLEKENRTEAAIQNYRIALQLTNNEQLKNQIEKRLGMLEVGRR